MLQRGFQFAPGYRLQEFLGRGQFGQVWRASAPGGAASAVKFLDLSDGQGQKEYDAIRRVKQIRHANLMPITAIWLLDAQGKVIEEAPDAAMETIDLSNDASHGHLTFSTPKQTPSWLVVAMLLGGKSLQQRLRECTESGLAGIPPKELLSYMEETAKAIDFLNMPQHDLGEGPIAIQHSDIKPANIVLIGSSAVVCDFGLARILTRNQVTATSTSGTPAYMAPECISGKPARTSDQYSLAVTYYHLRTGSLPFNEGSLWEVLDAHRLGKLDFGMVSQAEQWVLRKATHLQWENRFGCNVDFVESLREALRSEGKTQPAHLPTNASKATGTPEDWTRNDLEATVEMTDAELPASDRVSEALVKTVRTNTRPDVLDATRRTLDASSPVAQALTENALRGDVSAGDGDSTVQRSGGRRISGIIAFVSLLVLLGGIGLGISGLFNLPSDQRSGPGDGTATQDDSGQLLNQALALVDTDSESAVAVFQRVLNANPELVPDLQKVAAGEGPVMQMRVTSDGRWLVSMSDGPSAVVNDLSNTNAETRLLAGHDTLLNGFGIDSTGDLLLTGGFDSDVRVWNLNSPDSWQTPLLLTGLEGSIQAVDWSPNKPLAIAASSDMQLGLWEIGPSTTQQTFGQIERSKRVQTVEHIQQFAWDRDNHWIAATTLGSDPLTPKRDVVAFRLDELWNADGSPQPIRLGAANAKTIKFLSNQTEPTLAVGEVGGSVAIYSMAASDSLIKREESGGFNSASHIEALKVVDSDGQDFIVAGASDGSLVWWRYTPSSRPIKRDFCGNSISCLDVSSDGRWVAVGTNDGSVWLWDALAEQGSGAVMLSTDAGSVESIAMATETNWLAVGGDDGIIRLWNLAHVKLMALATPTDCGSLEVPDRDEPTERFTSR